MQDLAKARFILHDIRMSLAPKITIIIATYNAATTLPKCFASLQRLPCEALQILIQYGSSTDDTVAYVQEMQKSMPNLEQYSEQDNGIYDAWNKALLKVRGEWVLFLGADDTLLPTAFENFCSFLQSVPENIDIIASPSVVTNTQGDFLDTVFPSRTPHKALQTSMCFPHQGVLHRSRLFQHNLFSTQFEIVGDYEFTCRVLTASNYMFYDFPFATMCLGGISTERSHALAMHKECSEVALQNFGKCRSFLLFARKAKVHILNSVEKLFSEKTSLRLADSIRCFLGKPPLWAFQRTSQGSSNSSSSNKITSTLPNLPTVSLLIATVNRLEPLQKLLASLCEQNCQNLHILIADQNPSGYLDEVVSLFQNKLTITVMRVEKKGVSAARNILLPFATGDIIAFPDDDCWYGSHCLERIITIFKQQPHVGGVLCSWSNLEPCSTQEFHVLLVNRFNSFNNTGTIVQFYRKDAISEVLFDPILGPGNGLPYGSGEDTDFLLQVLAKNIPVIRCNEVLVYHEKPDFTDTSLLIKANTYALGRMYLLRKYKFPFWFKLLNIIYPLACLPKEGKCAWPYRKAMFLGRLKGFFQ